MPESDLQRILVIDDEPVITEVLKITLEHVGGYTVDVCNSGSDALNHIPDFNPDLVLLDVMMPCMDGPTTFAKIRELSQSKTLPIIFCTAKVQPSEVDEFIALGAIGVISKPFDPMNVSNELGRLWENRND